MAIQTYPYDFMKLENNQLLSKDLHVKLDRYFQINSTKWSLLSLSFLFFSHLYFGRDQYTKDDNKLHNKCDKRRFSLNPRMQDFDPLYFKCSLKCLTSPKIMIISSMF